MWKAGWAHLPGLCTASKGTCGTRSVQSHSRTSLQLNWRSLLTRCVETLGFTSQLKFFSFYSAGSSELPALPILLGFKRGNWGSRLMLYIGYTYSCCEQGCQLITLCLWSAYSVSLAAIRPRWKSWKIHSMDCIWNSIATTTCTHSSELHMCSTYTTLQPCWT